MLLKDFRPHSKLVTPTTCINQPRYPAIDAHNHLGADFGGGWDQKPLPELLDLLDEAGIVKYIDLDGGWGEELLNAHLDHFKQPAPERFQIFGGVDWAQWAERGNAFPEWAAARLRAQKARGAQGLKIWKGLGLSVRDPQGTLVNVDDPRLAPIWETAGELGLPVMIHVADPVAFFDPIDETNERWEEIGAHPEWAFTSPPFPPLLPILDGRADLVGRQLQNRRGAGQVIFAGADATGMASRPRPVEGALAGAIAPRAPSRASQRRIRYSLQGTGWAGMPGCDVPGCFERQQPRGRKTRPSPDGWGRPVQDSARARGLHPASRV